MKAHPELARAQDLSDRADKAKAHGERVDLLEEALESLQAFLEDEPSPQLSARAGNLRLTHARRVLSVLVESGHLDLEDTFRYFVLLITKLKPELDRVTAETPEFSGTYDRLKASHREELARILKQPASHRLTSR
jgi:hypothetical protein